MAFLYGRKQFENYIISDYDTEYDKYKYESVHTNFCKFALNVSKWSSNYGCRAELGRFPLMCKVFTLCIKYWLRAEQGTPNFIFNKAFQMVKHEKHPYIQGIQHLLCINGFNNIFEEPLYINRNRFGRIFQKTLEDQYIQIWHKKSRNSETLNILNILKDNYKESDYLHKITNVENRTMLTKLRLNQHNLHDCVGRKKNTSRICPLCGQCNESLSHFLISCPKLDTVRLPHFKNFNINLEWWNNLDLSKQLCILLSGELEIRKHFNNVKLISSLYKERKQLLDSSH
jgi:hypothetical protein